ncbi:MAG: hypothetical protein ACTSVK_10610, partial [Promethearchaeota archaeon]
FTREKVRKKIAFLEDPNSKEVFKDYINLSKYTHHSLKGYCEASKMKTYNITHTYIAQSKVLT